MLKEKKTTVFVKERTNTEKGNKFKAYSTKNPDGVYYQVRFRMDCENIHLLPNNNKPFVLVFDNNRAHTKIKNIVNTETGENFENRILYISAIKRIEEYIEPEIDDTEF